jgi:glycosyltransferase involved in cell wall biosynthesis
MKLLITTFTYPPNKDGVAEASRHLAESLVEKGWRVTVATGTCSESARSPEVEVVRFGLGPESLRSPEGRREITRYQEFVLHGGFDVVVNQCWEAWPTTYLQPVIRDLNAAKVMVSHGYALHLFEWQSKPWFGLGVWFRGLKWTIANLVPLIRRYDALVFLSPAKDLRRFFDHAVASLMGHKRIATIPNAAPRRTPDVSPGEFRHRYGIANGLLVLCVANYCERKNQKLALRAFREAKVPDSTLVFIGSELGEYGRSLVEFDEKLKSNSQGKVLFLEKITREETLEAFAASDVFMLAARAETQPIVLIEAMAAGKPWISTDTGCVKTMEGGVIRKGKHALAAALRDLATNPQERARLGALGRQAVESRYSPARTAEAYNQLLRSLESR